MANDTKQSSGVQELIDRLRDEGVSAGQSEADTLVTEARKQAMSILESFSPDIQRNLIAHAGLLAASIDAMSPQQIVITAGRNQPDMARALYGVSLPGSIQHILETQTAERIAPALEGKSAIDGKATAYACLGQQCSPPLTEPEDLLKTLQAQRKAKA